MQKRNGLVRSSGEKRIVIIKAVLLILIAVVSFLWLSKFASSTDTHSSVLEYLDKKESDALLLSTTTTVASAALTCIPDDVCTPIASQLASMSSILVLILGLLYFEEFMAPLLGYISFAILVPAGCASCIYGLLAQKKRWAEFGKKLIVFSLAIFLIIPVGVMLSKAIEKANSTEINRLTDYINEIQTRLSGIVDSITADTNFWNKIGSVFTSVGSLGSMVFDLIKQYLTYMVQSVAVLLVTTFAIPLVVMIAAILLVKTFFRVDPRLTDAARKIFFIARKGMLPKKQDDPDIKLPVRFRR